MITGLLLLAQVAATLPAAAPSPTGTSREVIVVGRRAKRELAACLARRCPPAQEVEASLQAAVEQFADGRYLHARRTLTRAIGRNKRHAADMPGPVSSLYATLATVAEHEGLVSIWKSAARNNVQVLRTHLGATTPATLNEEIHLADDMVGLDMPAIADGIYRKVQRHGLDTRQPMIAANASYRRAWLALLRERYRDAERLANEAVAIAGPTQPAMAELRDILRTRIAVRKGNTDAVDALAARLRQSATRTPTMLFAPSISDINPPTGAGIRGDHGPVRWADIGYWIRPDGRTAEIEMLRTSGLGQWRPAILKHVRARRYIPLDLPSASPGLYRIDRFTVRAIYGWEIGSRIPGRIGPQTVHVIDLTATDAMSEAHRERVAAPERASLPPPRT